MRSAALSGSVCRWAVLLLVLAGLVAVLVPTSVVTADSVVNFADSDLGDAVRESIGKPSGDIYESDIQVLGNLYAAGRGISSLGGLEACQDVGYVDLSNNQISSISPLANITIAEHLMLGHNQISSVAPLAGLTVVEVLDLSHNNISGLSSLTDFRVNTLDLSYNNIINIGPLVTGSGNHIEESLNLLENRNLDCDAHNTYIPMLLEDGVAVEWGCIYPDRPINQSPANGATTDSLTPTLQASAYHDKEGDSHAASTWRVIGADERVVWESGLSSPPATSITVPAGELDYSTSYFWDVGYKDSANHWSCYSKRTSFTTLDDGGPLPLAVTTGSAGSLTANSATLNGSLGGLGAASPVYVYFEWGPTTAYLGGTTPSQEMSHTGAFSAPITGLTPGTLYHFRAVAVGDTTVHGGDAAFTTPAQENLAPARPANVSPGSGASGVVPTPVLQASGFSDADGDGHAASSWQVRSETGSYDSPVWASVSGASTTSITVPAEALKHLKVYYWRVRYQDSRGAWSEYSPETSFTTADFIYADRPGNVSPAAGGTGVILTPVLQASAYHHAEGYPHIASSWQVRSDGGSYDSPAWESGLSSPAATSITVPTGELAHSTRYYWRVGYQDSRGLWSMYSLETAFTTLDSPFPPLQVTTVPADGVGSESVTLRLRLDGMGSTTPVQVSFEWGTTTAYGASTVREAIGSAGDYTRDLPGLTPETTYHFRAVAVGDSTVYGSDETFLTLPGGRMPPAVNTGDAETTASGSVLLKGELAWMGTAANVKVSFVWATAEEGPYVNETVGSTRPAVGSFQSELSGLAPGTTYYYKARGVGDGTGYGAVKQFTTGGMQPVVHSLVANNGRRGDSLTVTITGTNLGGATAVSFGEGITVTRLQAMSASLLTVEISIDGGAASGRRDVAVTTPRGTGSMAGAFEVKDSVGPTHLWVYLAAGAGGVLALGILGTILARVLRKRPAAAP